MQAIKLILVDKHNVFLESISQCLKKEKDLEVIGQATDGLTAIKLVKKKNPNLIITDLSMPVIDGVELITRLSESNPEIKLLIMAEAVETSSVKLALELGAKGYVSKDASIQELTKAIRLVDSGDSYIDPFLSKSYPNYISRALRKQNRKGPLTAGWKLTPQEKRILKLIMKGLTSKEIGQELKVSKRTVQNHRANIMKKFHTKNLVELVKFSLENQYLYD